jgi:MFS family permease
VEFNDFSISLWVVLAYTITFLGFTILANHLADVYGRRSLLLAGAIIFTAFSLAAGFAQSMNQVIAFRTLQGVGGLLLYSVGILCSPEMSSLRSVSSSMTASYQRIQSLILP